VVEALAHRRHDPFAIAASIGDGTVPSIVERCAACQSLHVDLRSLRDALRLAMSPRRTRDFQLDPGASAALRRTGWPRLTAWFGSPRDVVSRPIGSALLSLGVAGLLLVGVTAEATAPATERSGGAPALAAAPPTPTAARVTPAAGPADASGRDAASSPTHALGDLSMASLAAGGGILVLRRLSPGNRRAREVVQRTT
jgi:hypothetical protein